MKKILETQLNYIVNKSNLDRAVRDLSRLKRIGASEDEIARAKNTVTSLRERFTVSHEAIRIAGVSKTNIGK